MSLVLAVASFPELILFFVASNFVPQSSSSHSGNISSEMQPYHQKLAHIIVEYALLEGACFMNIVAYILERNWWSLGIAGVFVLFMLSNFPTETRFKHYAETQQTFL